MPSRLLPMLARDPAERGRTASPLELFFDLVFVVAVSVASVALHHDLTEDHVVDGVVTYAAVFFAIWWAWVNFTWFATAFDNDDWFYRVLTIVQMGGVLVLAAGIHDAFDDGDFAVITLGYVIMRLAMVTQWLRAGRSAPEYRATAYRYAAGITVVQVLWVLRLLLPESLGFPAFVLLALVEMAVPAWAERGRSTPWHAHHITERYGLFTLILLGESLLGSANAIIDALEAGEHVGELIGLSVLVLVSTAALWWIYFWPPHHLRIGTLRQSLAYGYGHYFIFAAAGALSAGVEVAIDVITDHSKLSDVAAGFTFSIPVAIFLLGVWLLTIRPHAVAIVNVAVPLGAAVVLLDSVIPIPFAITTITLVLVVIVLVRNPPIVGDGDAHGEAHLVEAEPA